MRKLLILAVAVIAAAFCVEPAAAKEPIKALIMTGQNNHNWAVSHLVLKQILEDSGLFTADCSVSPAKGEDMSQFSPDFGSYDVVVLDYNGDAWPESTKRDFVDYVRGGGGVVIYHAADNAFASWPEYNEMCAIAGWGGRNEKSGPYVYWSDGKLVKDYSAGIGGKHGHPHEYVLTARAKKHPVMKGLPEQWLHATDELYDHMRGPGNIKDCLFTAYSDPSEGGSGREEPMIFTVEYGKGRIFHTMLGHVGSSLADSPAMQCVGFQVTLLRGAEWAATGKVKQKVPADFPTADKVSKRVKSKAD